ncbi:orotidine-5'-phosphate decarboxylase [Sulfurospirillum sp. 1612]|uniref:orotidine-5'-phosphate decarboxylase n=1 Tax=Sulfurospirillum sp. 1612 TaxID=3094835 RepID=UPI002F944440
MELCVALDLPTAQSNLKLVKSLKDHDIWLKVGLRSFIRDGEALLKEIKAINPKFKLFLDLKIYDIPNTMADAAESMANLGVDMFNVHASSGKIAMSGVMKRLAHLEHPPLVLAVTALTSFDEKNFYSIYNETIEEKAEKFAKDAYESGLNGVVCSVFESRMIKSKTDPNFITLTPGIKIDHDRQDDQKRVATLELAQSEQSNIIVVGRPIYNSNDPLGVVENILKRIQA